MKKKKVDQIAEKMFPQGIVFCEECGVAVRKDKAVVGDKEVRTRRVERLFYYFTLCEEKDYIYQPYYCQWCAGWLK